MTKRGNHEAFWNEREIRSNTFSKTLLASSIISGKGKADDDHCFKYTRIPEVTSGMSLTPRQGLKRNSLSSENIVNGKIFKKEFPFLDTCVQRTLGEERKDGILLPIKTSLRVQPSGALKEQFLQWKRQYHPKELKLKGDESARKPPNVATLSRQQRVSQSSRESRERRVSSSSDDWKGIYLTNLHRRHRLIVRHPGSLPEFEPTERGEKKISLAPEEFPTLNMEGGVEPPIGVKQPNVHRVTLLYEETVEPRLSFSRTPPFSTHPPGKIIFSEQAPDKILNSNEGGDCSSEIIRGHAADLTAFCRMRQRSVENTNDNSTHKSPLRNLLPVLTGVGTANKKCTGNDVQSPKATSHRYLSLSEVEEMPPRPVQDVPEATNSHEEIFSLKSQLENIPLTNFSKIYGYLDAVEGDRTSEFGGKLTSIEESPRKKKRRGSDWAKSLLRRALSHSIEAKTDIIKNDSRSCSVGAGTSINAITDRGDQSKNDSKLNHPQQRRTSPLSLIFAGKAMEMNLPVFALPSPTFQRHSIASQNTQHSLLSDANFFFSGTTGRRRYDASAFKSVITASSICNMSNCGTTLKDPQPPSTHSSKSSTQLSENYSTCIFDSDFIYDGVNLDFPKKNLQKSLMSNRSEAEGGMGFFSATQCFSPVIPFAVSHPNRSSGSQLGFKDTEAEPH
ncbi:hypothetical protein TCDM_04355 [Trypanosoma cruzi Dm28c]|uniref:Uncharacterized protein n=1 Tax=Trypanosoma cruzi Dm28c TaxID=1416333 RepID=V5BR01_TRYCR|nr:hypothetical protein TCDM_04355 [Trypanosoma cruzi Dm28c]PBJ75940.1 hypothetical protein BCY84_10649 [Trypanosoma cruzi cruzi]